MAETKTDDRVMIGVRIPRSVKVRLERQADIRVVSVNLIVNKAIEEILTKMENQK